MSGRPLLYDFFCGQQGAGMGYAQAGWEVVGFDLYPQPRAPLEFRQMDALQAMKMILRGELPRPGGCHASPPCQFGSDAQRIRGNEHPNYIPATRELLKLIGVPYVIENVWGTREHLRSPVLFCGTMFGQRQYRHRLFETTFPLPVPDHPEHIWPQAKMGRPPRPGEFIQCVGNFSNVQLGREVMGMPWANRDGLREAVPPAYTRWIGKYMMMAVRSGGESSPGPSLRPVLRERALVAEDHEHGAA